ncbi:UDP-N-acetylmuramyl-tripeptide synthetase [bacterium]|nr:UDP-N-acetylmuramyl-tripeptide synthetase [bacterium]
MQEWLYRAKRYYHFFKTGLRGFWAAVRYQHPEKKLKVILVTGTDGKTTTSSLIYHLLKNCGYKVALLSTVAAYIGEEKLDTGFHVTSPSPADLYRYMAKMVDAGMEYLVLELTSQGAYQWRAWGIQAEIAALTNIDQEHLDYHLTFENYLAAKMLVLNAARVAVVNDEMPCFSQVKKSLHSSVNLITFNHGSRFSAPLEKAVREHFREDYNRLNAFLALTVAKQFKLTDKQLEEALQDFRLPEGRLQVVPNQLGFTMIVDFAHTPQALAAVLPAIRKQYLPAGKKLIGIVGCAGLRDRHKRPVMGRIMAEQCDIAIFTAEDPRTENIWSIIAQMKQDLGTGHRRVISIANREAALRWAIDHYGHDGNVIAIFGKGHEQSMNYDGVHETLWNDVSGAQKIMRERETAALPGILTKQHFFLMGVKGVGMTALASCLLDAGKSVTGSDSSERFPTSRNLERLKIPIIPLDCDLPADTQVVIYTGSHGGHTQKQVKQAIERGLPVYSHMEALSWFFDHHQGIAVCGVGGKSSISAMLAFVSQKLAPQSYAVGVGEIIGLPKTGQYLPDSDYFIAEADEYVADPTTIGTDKQHLRFLYLHPQIIICPNLRFDHPDVYRDFAHTKEAFLQFFCQLKPGGTLIYNGDDLPLQEVVSRLRAQRPDVSIITYGLGEQNDYCLAREKITLSIPGEYNRLNALACFAATQKMGLPAKQVRTSLHEYQSVLRRMQLIRDEHDIQIWDDYAHHPSEIVASIAAIKERTHKRRLIVAFQPHTYSRTKQLLPDFIESLAAADNVWLLDIYPSARESFDPTISSQMIVDGLKKKKPTIKARLLGGVADLRETIAQDLRAGDTLLLLGAGDIYHAVRDD